VRLSREGVKCSLFKTNKNFRASGTIFLVQVASHFVSNYALERMDGTHGKGLIFRATAQFEADRWTIICPYAKLGHIGGWLSAHIA
jgi:hypothetical protein